MFRNKKSKTLFATTVVSNSVKYEDYSENAKKLLYISYTNFFKKTNTYYTIDGINALMIKKIGIIDKTYKINWSQYKNTVISTVSEKYLINKRIKQLARKLKRINNNQQLVNKLKSEISDLTADKAIANANSKFSEKNRLIIQSYVKLKTLTFNNKKQTSKKRYLQR